MKVNRVRISPTAYVIEISEVPWLDAMNGSREKLERSVGNAVLEEIYPELYEEVMCDVKA